jgi:glutathione S-transferase
MPVAESPCLPILYSFRRCPFAMRARLALLVSGQVCELREVALRSKPGSLLQASPKGTVPVLVLQTGEVLEQSRDIMHWALERNDPLGWRASNADEAQAMETLVNACDSHFKQALDRTKYPQRYPDEDSASHRAVAETWLQALEDKLSLSPWLFGAQARWADMAILPFVRQFAGIDTQRWQAYAWPHLQQWLAQWQASSLFAAIMVQHAPWQEGTEGPHFGPLA